MRDERRTSSGSWGSAPSASRSRSRPPRPTCRRSSSKFTDSGTLIGLVLGAEGVFALCVSPVIGPWSDTFHTPLGRRRPFMLAALGPIGFCLLLMPFMPNLWTTCLIVLAFFFAYYVYEPPYRGLYPDLLHAEHLRARAGRAAHLPRDRRSGSRSSAAASCSRSGARRRSCVAAVVTTAACGAVHLPRARGARAQDSRVFEGVAQLPAGRAGRSSDEEPEVRRFLFANAAWEGTFAAPRTFVVLYVTKGLGRAEVDLVGGARRGRGRLRARGDRRRAARRPVRARAGDLRRLVRLRRRAPRRRARRGVARLVLRLHPPGRVRRRAR